MKNDIQLLFPIGLGEQKAKVPILKQAIAEVENSTKIESANEPLAEPLAYQLACKFKKM